jgi:hypothetical protein
MKYLKCLALLPTLALLIPLSASARDKSQHSVDILDSVQVGTTRLKAGNYKVEWQGAGPAVEVIFLQRGKTVASAPATLQTNDKQVTWDDVVIDKTRANTKTLEEIDFAHQKEALVFAKSGM